MIVGLVFLVTIIGLLMYILANHAKVAEIGRIMFAFGLLVLLLGGDRILKILMP